MERFDAILYRCLVLFQNVDEKQQMTVAILLILWVSALASAFIDNIPFTAAIVSVSIHV